MNWLTSLFTANTVEKTVDGIYNGIDKAIYTDEEKADGDVEIANLKLLFLKAYEPFKIAQRFLALIYSIPFVLIHLAGAICLFIGKNIENAKVAMEWNEVTLGDPAFIILTFYFLGGAAEGSIRAYTDNRKETRDAILKRTKNKE